MLQQLRCRTGQVLNADRLFTKSGRIRHALPVHPRCVRRLKSRQSTHIAASKLETPEGLRIPDWTGDAAQVKALEALRQRMAGEPYELPTEDTLRWFLLDRKLDVEEAAGKLVSMLRADLITVTDVAKEAATGKACLHTHRDVLGRPVILVRAAKHVTGQTPLRDSERLCVHLLDRAVQQLEQEGGEQRTVLGVFDLRGFSSKNADLGFIRFLVDIFFTYYPKRLSQVLLVDAPWVFRPGWEMVRPWLKKYSALVRFVSAEEVRREYFTPLTVPEDFKGKPFPER